MFLSFIFFIHNMVLKYQVQKRFERLHNHIFAFAIWGEQVVKCMGYTASLLQVENFRHSVRHQSIQSNSLGRLLWVHTFIPFVLQICNAEKLLLQTERKSVETEHKLQQTQKVKLWLETENWSIKWGRINTGLSKKNTKKKLFFFQDYK